MKNVLLTTDFSDNSRNAIEYAFGLFGTKDVKYTLLNTYSEPSGSSNVMVSIADYLKKESIEGLDLQVERLRADYPDLDIIPLSQYGGMTTVINRFAASGNFDYAVVGTKGSSAIENMIMGSNTMDAVRSSKIPLVVVPQETAFQPLQRMALAADYKEFKHANLIDSMVDLAKHINAEINVINVRSEDDTPYNDAVEGFELHNSLEGSNHSFHSVVNNNIVEGLSSFVKANEIGMLTLVARHHNFFERLFHKSITKEFSMLADIPLLVLHD